MKTRAATKGRTLWPTTRITTDAAELPVDIFVVFLSGAQDIRAGSQVWDR